MNRTLRLALAAGVAALAAASSPAAHATYCNPDPSFKLVCATIERVCQSTEPTRLVCSTVQ